MTIGCGARQPWEGATDIREHVTCQRLGCMGGSPETDDDSGAGDGEEDADGSQLSDAHRQRLHRGDRV